MLIGVDTSGKFEFGAYEPTVVAAAVAPEETARELAQWTTDALQRWGRAGTLSELHAQELGWPERREVCEMLAARDDLRLAAVVTDSLLLRSPAALRRHRERQIEKIELLPSPTTQRGRDLRERALELLRGEQLTDGDYALIAVLPMIAMAAAQRAVAFFAADADRHLIEELKLHVDKEAAVTVRYGNDSLFPVLSGDPRFRLRLPAHWREDPRHPLLKRALALDGDGLVATELFSEFAWVDSHAYPLVQVADVVAWVLRRTLKNPAEAAPAELFSMLKPLLAGEGGATFELFSIGPIPPELRALYAHLQGGAQPPWWLEPA